MELQRLFRFVIISNEKEGNRNFFFCRIFKIKEKRINIYKERLEIERIKKCSNRQASEHMKAATKILLKVQYHYYFWFCKIIYHYFCTEIII